MYHLNKQKKCICTLIGFCLQTMRPEQRTILRATFWEGRHTSWYSSCAWHCNIFRLRDSNQRYNTFFFLLPIIPSVLCSLSVYLVCIHLALEKRPAALVLRSANQEVFYTNPLFVFIVKKIASGRRYIINMYCGNYF